MNIFVTGKFGCLMVYPTSWQRRVKTAYITLVRSTLEYAASIWDPRLVKDCDLLEKLQRVLRGLLKGITGMVWYTRV